MCLVLSGERYLSYLLCLGEDDVAVSRLPVGDLDDSMRSTQHTRWAFGIWYLRQRDKGCHIWDWTDWDMWLFTLLISIRTLLELQSNENESIHLDARYFHCVSAGNFDWFSQPLVSNSLHKVSTSLILLTFICLLRAKCISNMYLASTAIILPELSKNVARWGHPVIFRYFFLGLGVYWPQPVHYFFLKGPLIRLSANWPSYA